MPYNHEATKNSYSVTVKASDSTDSDTITVTISVTDVAEQPSKPSAPTVSAVTGSATSLSASWSAPGLNDGPALTGYEMQYRAGSTGAWSSSTSHGATVTTATITGLTADTAYQVQVRALNGETPSDWSDPSAAVKTNDLPKLSVASVSAEEGTSLTFTVTLTPASMATVTVRWAASSLVKAGNDAVAGHGLHGGERDADLRRERDVEAGHGGDARGHDGRGQRDLHADAVEPDQRGVVEWADGAGGDRHDRQQRHPADESASPPM